MPSKTPILKNIRKLLTEGFSEIQLRNDLCFYENDFRPVYDQLALSTGKSFIVDQILEFSERTLKTTLLLLWAKKNNFAIYEKFSPYYEDEVFIAEDKIRILFLAANPTKTTWLRLDEESRSIDQALHKSKLRDLFELTQQWAVQASELQSHLLRYKPSIVHFSGHGNSKSELIMEDQDGNAITIPTLFLSELFSILKDNLKCVVLNACFSEQQAVAIAQQIDYVIGMSTSIGDKAAIIFASSFYQALGYGKDIENAFNLARLQISLESTGEEYIPKLLSLKAKPS